MVITLEKFDSITIKDPVTYIYKTYMAMPDMTFNVGTEIDTDTYPGVQEIARKYIPLFITDSYKELMDRSSGMTTNMQNVNRK